MKQNSFQKMICMIMLIAVLIPYGVSAQDDVQASSSQTFSNEELTQMLAPIALYPDSLLSQILIAATYPFDVVEAERWLTKNPYIKSDALDEALKAKDWDVSILSLCHYPKILTMMSENISWTARMGDAFANQEQDVMDTIQELRARARAAGNLSTTKEQNVIVEDRFIRVEPVNPEYIYVPAYDPYVIYGSWWLPLFPPFPIILPGLIVTGPGIVFSPGFYFGFDWYGWCRFNWRERHITIINIDRTRRFNRHIDVYRPMDNRPWRPDIDRRHLREKRAGEIPRFHPPVKPTVNGPRPDRKPGGPVITPDKRRDPSGKPRVINDKTKFDHPVLDDKDRKSAPVTPGVINRDKRPRVNQPDIEKDKPIRQPRVIDRSNLPPSNPKATEDRRPVIQDRGNTREIEPQDHHFAPGEGRESGSQPSMDRPTGGGMHRENRR